MKTKDLLVRFYWYLGKLKECHLGCKHICSCELFFPSTWNRQWLVHTTREYYCSSDCSKSSEKNSRESVNLYRLALHKILFKRPWRCSSWGNFEFERQTAMVWTWCAAVNHSSRKLRRREKLRCRRSLTGAYRTSERSEPGRVRAVTRQNVWRRYAPLECHWRDQIDSFSGVFRGGVGGGSNPPAWPDGRKFSA